jgi:hypothetical protein
MVSVRRRWRYWPEKENPVRDMVVRGGSDLKKKISSFTAKKEDKSVLKRWKLKK